MTKFRKTVAILLALVLVLCTGLPAMAAESTDAATNTTADSATTTAETAEYAAVEGTVAAIEKYGNLDLDITPEALAEAGYEVGDMVNLEIDGTSYKMPIGTNYSDVDNGSMVLVLKPAEEGSETPSYTVAAINMGNLAEKAGVAKKNTDEEGNVSWLLEDGTVYVESSVKVTVTMAEKDGYDTEYMIHQLERTDVREDYASDAIFANFRAIPGVPAAYRTSSPVDNDIGRAAYADDLIEAAGVKAVLNLANNDEAIKGFIAAEDFDSPYYQSLFEAGKVKALNLGVDFAADDFKAGLAEGLRWMSTVEGPYAIHCTEGKDRAGFVSALLECLMGATYQQIVADYMVTYENYYHVDPEKDSEKYNAIAESNIVKTLASIAGEDAAKADLAAAAETYLKDIGLTADEITALKTNLAVEAPAPAESAEPAESAAPTESAEPAESTAPAESEAPTESTEPAESEAPAESTAPEASGNVVILHSNDVHGAIEGYATMAALKAYYEAKGDAVLVVDAGDYIQGETCVSESQGATAIELMNMAGYDFAALGNHEFDYGFENLKTILEKAEFQVLSANTLYDGAAAFGTHAVVEKNGLKIGIFGLETPETATKAHPAKIKGVTFSSGVEMYACAQAEVAALEAEGCDYIICLGHLGVDDETAATANRSIDLLKNVTGIDVLIDGHSHSTIEDIEGKIGTDTNKVGDTYVTSTGTKFDNYGVVTIAKDGTITTELISKEDAAKLVTPDETVKARIDAIMAEIEAKYGATFAKTEVLLNGEREPGNRTEETNLGDLITDSMLWCATKESGLEVDADHVVAITNGGGIRATIEAGDISRNDVHTVLPFGNTVAIVYVKGSALLEVLEASTSSAPDALGGFPQVAGINFTVDTSIPYDQGELYPGSTYYAPASIKRVTIQSINGQPFDPDATYAVVTNDFCAAGGDTYYAFSVATVMDTGTPMDEALIAYIDEKLDGVITAADYGETKGRITVSAAAATEPEPETTPAPEPQVPDDNVPPTGDVSMVIWFALAALSGTGLVATKKRKED